MADFLSFFNPQIQALGGICGIKKEMADVDEKAGKGCVI
jgi:hypothetical protein